MLAITLPPSEDQDELVLHFEHSLVSLSKWESKWETPFYNKEQKTEEQTKDYVYFMCLDEGVPYDFVNRLGRAEMNTINEYINSKQTATWFQEDPNNKGGSREVVTAELIYYWMISFKIPFSCETWHINKLMTLIKICGIKNTKPKRMSRQAQAEEYRRLNEQRRAASGSRG